MFAPHRKLKRIFFIKEFLKYIQDEKTEVFVLDEAGKVQNLLEVIYF